MPQSMVSCAPIQGPVSTIEKGLDASNERLRPHACLFPGCTQRFKRKYTLKDHMNMHTGEKPFVCPVRACRKTFTTSGNLARHKRLHPWLETPLPCHVDGCQCEFPTVAKLERHMLSHFDESKVHRCDFGACGRVFSTLGNLRRHWKHSHSRPRKFPRSFETADPLVYTDSSFGSFLSSDNDLLEALVSLFGDHEAECFDHTSSTPWETTM